jgi:hypothetical protein
MNSDPDEPPDLAALERELEVELHRLYDECSMLDYRPTRFLAMLREHGARETAYRILAGPDGHEGFTRVLMLGRTDLTVEAVVLDDRFRPLFSDEQRAVARRRLPARGP